MTTYADSGAREDADVPDDFLATSAAAFASRHLVDTPGRAEETGAIIGRYRLVEELGRGGMGTVWLAERADGHFEQRAALKLIRRGMDTDDILARFLRERQILARLEHRNIARLLDGGVSEDGRPYFVMEHVAGTPITQYCADRKTSREERLRLFIAVCHAVQYAHRNLVVHRDIKPANVLINDAGEVRLLDFGVAKVLSPDRPDESSTAPMREPMTPGYASPEQRSGAIVTTASDVYQLGVLLHELLTSQRPPADHDASPRVLRGDLDAITSRALQAEPEQRYPSAETLADDVERHLAHLPLRFGAGGWRYTTAKFVRRYRVVLATAALVVVIVIGLTLAYLSRVRTERDLARHEATKAAENAATLRELFRGWNPDAADRDKVSVGMLLDEAARRAHVGLRNQPEVLAATLSMIGDLQAGIGRKAAADSLLSEALTILERPGRASRDLAVALSRRGSLLNQLGRTAEAEVSLRRALLMYQSVFASGTVEVVQAQRDLAEALWKLQRHAEADSLLRAAAAGVPRGDMPISTEIRSELGYVLFLEGRYDEAVAELRPVLATQRRIMGTLNSSTLNTMRRLASALRGPAAFAEAEALDREALAMSRTLFGAAHAQSAGTAGSLAVLLEREGNLVAADSFARAALAASIPLYGEKSDAVVLMLRTLGGIRLALGDVVEAEQLLRRSLAAFPAAFPPGNPDEGDVLNRLASLLINRRAADADSIYRRAVNFERARSLTEPYFITDGYEYLGAAAAAKGDVTLAERMYRRAITLYAQELPKRHPYREQAERGLAALPAH